MDDLKHFYAIISKTDDNCYVYDYINNEIWKITNDEYQMFEHAIQTKNVLLTGNSSQTVKFILNIKSGRFFSRNPVKFYGEKLPDYGYIISFPVSHQCNLQCRYCFAKSGENYTGDVKKFSKDILNKIVPFLNQVSNHKIKKIRLEFVGGGETFLHKNLFFELLQTFENIACENGIHLEVFVQTNGTMLDSDIVSFIKEHNLSLGISIDGPQYIHDYQRPFPNGKGSYDKVVENIRGLNNFWIVSVITSKTKSLVEVLHHNIVLGAKSMEIRIVRGGASELALTAESLIIFKKMYRELEEYFKANIDDIAILLNNYDSWGKLIKRIITNEKVLYRCQAGNTKFSFAANGDIYPCDSFVGNSQYLLGNLNDTQIDITNHAVQKSVDSIKQCSECQYRYICGGECYYHAICHSGDDVFCELQKYLIDLAIDLVYYIQTYQPEKYHVLKNIARLKNLV